MKFQKRILTCVMFLFAGAPALADQIIVSDFEDTPYTQLPGNAVWDFDGFTLTSGACDFTTTGFSGLENGVDGSDNGTTHLFASDVTITCDDVFDLLSWDMGPDFQEDPFEWFTDLYYADGSSIIGVGGPMNAPFDFITWSAVDPEFTSNLVSFRIYTDLSLTDPLYNQPYQLAIDNFTVRVPEPGTLALFAIGLLGFGLAVRRRET